MRALVGGGVSTAGMRASHIADEPIGEVHVTGVKFAALAERVADDRGLRSFFSSWGYSDPADRLVAANAVLFELGYDDSLGHEDTDMGHSPYVNDSAVPPTYIPPGDVEARHWKPDETPKPFRVGGDQDWSERRIRDIPNTTPIADTKQPREFLPGSSRWPYNLGPAADPFGDRSKYPKHPAPTNKLKGRR